MSRIKIILTDLAINIQNAINEDWMKSILYIEVLQNFSSYSGKYFKSSECNGHSISVSKFDFKIDMDLIELHRITTENKDMPYGDWNKAIFILYVDNKFEIEYIWDQELQDKVDGYNSNSNV